MKQLLHKEFRLVLHPTSVLFLLLSALLLVPNYSYYITFFYTALGLFFTCLNSRERHDIAFSIALPVRKRDLVRARFGLALCMEALQLLFCVPFALLRSTYQPGNQLGIEANAAFFGSSLVLLGLFHLVFFPLYFGNPDKVGRAFLWGSGVIWGYILAAEASVHIVPFARTALDTLDPAMRPVQWLALFIGALVFFLLTWGAYRKSVRRFEALDL